MASIFNSLRVLEIANVLAGPTVGQFFAELGAEVVKVENPKTKGDVTRSWKLKNEAKASSVSAYFSAANSGKKSIALDLESKKDLSVFYGLVEKSDIVIASYKAGDAEKLMVDYKSLKSINSKIIYGSITAYGEKDPRMGYDAIIQAESGFMKMNGEPDGNSLKMPVALVDILAAHQLKEALLLAYIQRLKVGKGAFVSVSLFDAAISSLANQATNYLVAGQHPGKMGTEHPNIAPYGTLLKTADGEEILLAVGTDSQFQRLAEVLGIADLATDQQFSTNSLRVKNRSQLNALLLEKAKEMKSKVLIDRLRKAQVPAGRLQSVAEVLSGEEADRVILKSVECNFGLRTFVGKLSFSENTSNLFPPPQLDEHREEILALLQQSDL